MMKYAILFFAGILLGCSTDYSTNKVPVTKKKVIAYVTEWQDNWGKDYEKANQITHINYAFANIEDGKVVEGAETDGETLKKLNGLKQVNPDLKILISVGGWTWSKHFSDAALTENSRDQFANSAIAFMQRHEIDGIDLDWEYPGLPGAGNTFRKEDKENFTALLKLIREKLDDLSDGKSRYLLTIASAASQAYLDNTNLNEAHQYLDFINIMTYDFHGEWEKQTGHHSNLMPSDFDVNEMRRCASLAVHQHLKVGIPPEKIMLGVPFYGRWWKGVDPSNKGLYQKAKIGGSINYAVIADSLIEDSSFILQWDSIAQVPFLWRGQDSLFVSFDDPRSIKIKVDYVKEHQMGGLMFWQFNGDNGELLESIDASL